jgi:hypothetical protein
MRLISIPTLTSRNPRHLGKGIVFVSIRIDISAGLFCGLIERFGLGKTIFIDRRGRGGHLSVSFCVNHGGSPFERQAVGGFGTAKK